MAHMFGKSDSPSFFGRLKEKLSRSAARLSDEFVGLFRGRKIDAELLEDLETRLIGADVGMEATQAILEELRQKVARHELADVDALLVDKVAADKGELSGFARVVQLNIDLQRMGG